MQFYGTIPGWSHLPYRFWMAVQVRSRPELLNMRMAGIQLLQWQATQEEMLEKIRNPELAFGLKLYVKYLSNYILKWSKRWDQKKLIVSNH